VAGFIGQSIDGEQIVLLGVIVKLGAWIGMAIETWMVSVSIRLAKSMVLRIVSAFRRAADDEIAVDRQA